MKWQRNKDLSGIKPFEHRKRMILETAGRLQRPIWIGDLATPVSTQGSFAKTFRALVDEGVLERVEGPSPPPYRVYFRIKGSK